jgi:hypothetical protein
VGTSVLINENWYKIAHEMENPGDSHGLGFVFLSRPDYREIVWERLE